MCGVMINRLVRGDHFGVFTEGMTCVRVPVDMGKETRGDPGADFVPFRPKSGWTFLAYNNPKTRVKIPALRLD